ncbi:MAG: peptidoglycan DD-metalloendopeptidase family protein [Xanthomonadaceae bacterium]|nr:peptidoglycan DD-metalloendopeptidase family protein [Xanthomonadaceae bacterium]
MFLLVFCIALSPAHAQSVEPDAAAKAVELEELRTRIRALRLVLERDLTRQDRARAALRDSEQTVARQAAILRETGARLEASRSRLAQLARQRRERDLELQAERDALAGQLRAAHALGRQERMKLLMNQEDPAAVGRVLVYHDYLNRSRLARITRVSALLDEIDTLEVQIVAETSALESASAEQAETVAALERTREQRAAAIAAIEREVLAQGRRLQRMEADEQSLAALLESLADVLADVPAELGTGRVFEELRGALAWPTRGELTGRFGQRREGTGRTRGVLIAAPAGTEVRAIAYGRVAWAGWMPHYGNLMVIEHGNDYFSLYGHNQALLREVGEWVGAGEPIAQVGDSGGQPQSALYFELRKGPTPLNPQQWLVNR